MALHTVTVSLDGVFQDANPFAGRIRFRLCRPSRYEDDSVAVYPERWQEAVFSLTGDMSVELVPNEILSPENTWYEFEVHAASNKRGVNTLLQSGCVYVPDHDCSLLDILTEPVSDTPASAEAFASQAKQSAATAEHYADQAGDKYRDVQDAAATALRDIGAAKDTAVGAVQAKQVVSVQAVTDAGDAKITVMNGLVQDARDAKTAAETAQGKAETAQGKAETAQGKAEDAQTAAETAQGKAEAAQTAAEAAASKIWTAYATAESEQAAEQIDMSALTDGGLMIVTITN